MKYSAVQLIRKSFQIAILTSVLSTVLRADSTIFFEGSFEAAQLVVGFYCQMVFALQMDGEDCLQ